MEFNGLRGILKSAVGELPEQVRHVMIFRYGLQDGRKQPVEKVAKKLKTTLPRVVGMENEGIRKLRRPDVCVPIFDALDQADTFIWSQISTPISEAGSLMPKSENYEHVVENLPGEIFLAIRYRYNKITDWLKNNTFQTDHFWFRSSYSPERVREGLESLCGILDQNPPPFHLGNLVEQLKADDALVRFILALSPLTWGFYRGYAALRPISSAALRAIRIHLLFIHKYLRAPMVAEQIAEIYNSVYHDDQINETIAESIMQPRSLLFCESRARTWSAQDFLEEHLCYAGIDDVAHAHDGPFSDSRKERLVHVYERPWSETTAVDIIREILEEKGICRRAGIMKIFHGRTGGRYKAVTVEAGLSWNEEFLKLAPRVFGLRNAFAEVDPMNTWTELLLTRGDCHLFVRERYAGEPMNSYPLWTPVMEQQWCFWAEKDSKSKMKPTLFGNSEKVFHSRLFQSLLYIAQPMQWPVSDEIKTAWTFKKQALSQYQFKSPLPEPIWRKTISLQDLFSVTLAVKRLGYSNWVQVSAVLSLGRNPKKTAGVLCLLIALGIILPSEHWQKRHESGPQVDSALLVMEKEIRKKGFVHWLDEAGGYFKDRLRESIDQPDLGWVSGDFIRRFLEPVESRKITEKVLKKNLSRPVPGEEKPDAGDKANFPEQLILPF